MGIDRTWELAFLEGLRLRGQRQLAADFAGVHIRTVRRHELKDAEFRRRSSDARADWRQAEAERKLRDVQRLLGGRRRAS